MSISIKTRTVFRSSIAGRAYLTKRAAIAAEARALIQRRYPTERPWHDEIGPVDPGFHWTALRRSDVLFRRVKRLVAKAVQPCA